MIIHVMRGLFIVFEGIDGAGLTTHATLLEKWFKERGYKVVLTKEPTHGLIGGLIKACLKHEWKTSPDALQLLFSADRAHHLAFEIKPALEEGKFVISDRYLLSTIAYGMMNLNKEWLKAINSTFLLPDITFIMDIEVDVALRRIGETRFGAELFEKKQELERVRKNFLELSKEYENCFVIRTDDEIEEVQKRIEEIVEKFLKEG